MATIARQGLSRVCTQRVTWMAVRYGIGTTSTAAPVSTQRPVAKAPATRMVYSNLHPFSTSCKCLAEANIAQKSGPEVPDVPVVTYDFVKQNLQTLRLFDVRKIDEVAEYGIIPGALILPVDDIESALKLPAGAFKVKYGFAPPTDLSEKIIVYCRSGVRADRAAKILRDKFGFTNVVNYKGSWKEWAEKHPEDVKKPLPKS